ncbi:hypothetical protein GOP47_0030895, partial [Adiantum capillus-veneris]
GGGLHDREKRKVTIRVGVREQKAWPKIGRAAIAVGGAEEWNQLHGEEGCTLSEREAAKGGVAFSSILEVTRVDWGVD